MDTPLFLHDPPPLTPPRSAVAIRAARAKLNAPRQEGSIWPVLGAAALAAGTALMLAMAVIVGLPTF
jgi:hypothetical protein